MVNPEPFWCFTARHQVYRWYGHVHLAPDQVYGTWFALNRSNGHCLWERKFWRPNSIVGFTKCVIIASECRSDGPWTADFGCYGIDATTGDLRWTSHRNGGWGKLVRLFDFIPGFTNEFRDDPEAVDGDRVLCSSGRILDTNTGKPIQSETLTKFPSRFNPSDAQRLYGSIGMNNINHPLGSKENSLTVDVNGETILTRFDPKTLKKFESIGQVEWDYSDLKFYGLGCNRSIQWKIDLNDTGYHFDSSFYDYRYCRPYVFCVVAEKPLTVPDKPSKPVYVRYQASRRHLLALDARSGELVQDILLGNDEATTCRIEDVDQQGLLISQNNKSLLYYVRE